MLKHPAARVATASEESRAGVRRRYESKKVDETMEKIGLLDSEDRQTAEKATE